MKKVMYMWLIVQLILGLTFVQPHTITYAQEVPNREEIRQEINTQAQQEFQSSVPESSNTSSQQTTNTTSQEQPAQNQTEVANTGDNAHISQTDQNNTTTDVNNNNTTQVNQNVNATANTGYNEASGNISFGGNAGIIVTGNAGVATSASVNSNNNNTYIAPAAGTVGQSSSLTNTGNGLSYSQSSTNNLLTAVNGNNTTYINQAVNATANTGGNKAEGNIAIGGGQAGLIITGAALTSTNLLVAGNGSVVLIGGENDGAGPGSGASIILLNTGDSPRLRFYSERETKMMVNNNNNAIISQTCGAPSDNTPSSLRQPQEQGCYVNTGNNTSNGNIAFGGDAGVIHTGNAAIGIGLQANVNSNETHISGGSEGGSTSADIINTGDDADIDIDNSSSTEVGVNNNNNAQINQHINAYANTGYNTANGNISFGGNAGVITTGNAVILVGLAVQANENDTEIEFAARNDNTNQGNQPTYDACGNLISDLSVVNSGDNLDINQDTSSNTEIGVRNTNYLNARQYINARVNTGDNESNGNITEGSDAGLIQTGNAVVQAGMNVQGNTNKTSIGCELAMAVPTPTPTNPPSVNEVTPTPTRGQQNNPTPTPTKVVTNGNGGFKGGGGKTTTTTTYKSNGGGGGGDVLGASISRLPTAGTFENLLIIFAAIAMLSSGKLFKKLAHRLHNASRHYKFNHQERG